MKIFYFCVGAAFALVFRFNLDRRRAFEGARPRRVPANGRLDASEELAGPLGEV